MDTHTDRKSSSDANPNPLPGLLTAGHITNRLIPIDARTLYRWISAGMFPKADIAIGAKVRFWRRETVENWINERPRPRRPKGRAGDAQPTLPRND